MYRFSTAAHLCCASPPYTAAGMGVGAVFFPPTISSCKNSESFFFYYLFWQRFLHVSITMTDDVRLPVKPDVTNISPTVCHIRKLSTKENVNKAEEGFDFLTE